MPLIQISRSDTNFVKEINENIYIDLDSAGNLVAMTIEHARKQASLPCLSYEQIEKRLPNERLHRIADKSSSR
jgi:uncharacterized protein YuzE